MNAPAHAEGPTVEELFVPFSPARDSPTYVLVSPEAVPPPYHDLLVHEHHMTVTVEAHHGDLVQVRILERRLEGDHYTRKIVLALESSGRIVQFGIARVHLDYCSEPVREAIIAGKTPLGRILIQHNVLRRVEPTAFLRIHAGPAQMAWFGLEKPQTLYGRLGIIHCDGKPALEVLEIVAPEADS